MIYERGVIVRHFILNQKLNSIKLKLVLCKTTQNMLPSFSDRLKKNICDSSIKIFSDINENTTRKLNKG